MISITIWILREIYWRDQTSREYWIRMEMNDNIEEPVVLRVRFKECRKWRWRWTAWSAMAEKGNGRSWNQYGRTSKS